MSDSDINEEARFLRLFIKNEGALRAYARALLPNWEAVDDVLQDASLVMWKKLEKLQDDSGFLPWAKVIIRFEALHARRKYARDRLVFDENLINLLADTAERTTGNDFRQNKVALESCLGKLTANHRNIILASYSSDTTVKELAEESGVTPNAYYKLVGRLRAKIFQCVELKVARSSNSK